MMTADQYLRSIIRRERVHTTLLASPAVLVKSYVRPVIEKWAGQQLVTVEPSGSIAKGTAVRSGTDVDLFVSLASTTSQTLQEVYFSLESALKNAGYSPRLQNVSLGINVEGYDVDVVPGKRQNPFSADHSLYRRRADTWTKTNVNVHINAVKRSHRLEEIMILKIWRNQNQLDFPSFLLELVTIQSCYRRQVGDLATNVAATFEYIRDNIEQAIVIDPANTNNRVSDDMSNAAKTVLKRAAKRAIDAPMWGNVVQ